MMILYSTYVKANADYLITCDLSMISVLSIKLLFSEIKIENSNSLSLQL